MSLTFYYAPMSSASPTHWILEELKIPYEKVLIDLKAEAQKKEAFLKINPNGKVPVITHDGTTIFESVAIAIYLGETFGVERGLFPPPGAARGKAVQWLVWCNVSLGDAISRHFRNSSDYIPADQRNAKAADVAKTDVEKHLSILNSALEGKEYLVDTFSLVDAHLCSWVSWIQMSGFDLRSYPAITAWRARCLARPAAGATENS